MPKAVDLMGTGEPAEEALRNGDTFVALIPSVATTIGGANGATVIELASGVTTVQAVMTFLATTEIDRGYTIYNTGTACSITVPVSAGSVLTSLFQNASSTFSLTSTKTAFIQRLGVIGTVNTTTDRWIYTLSA